jgi:hypothetical protein
MDHHQCSIIALLLSSAALSVACLSAIGAATMATDPATIEATINGLTITVDSQSGSIPAPA